MPDAVKLCWCCNRPSPVPPDEVDNDQEYTTCESCRVDLSHAAMAAGHSARNEEGKP